MNPFHHLLNTREILPHLTGRSASRIGLPACFPLPDRPVGRKPNPGVTERGTEAEQLLRVLMGLTPSVRLGFAPTLYRPHPLIVPDDRQLKGTKRSGESGKDAGSRQRKGKDPAISWEARQSSPYRLLIRGPGLPVISLLPVSGPECTPLSTVRFNPGTAPRVDARGVAFAFIRGGSFTTESGLHRFRCRSPGKYPTKWTDLARKYRTLPSILDTGTNFSRKAAPHLASFIDVL